MRAWHWVVALGFTLVTGCSSSDSSGGRANGLHHDEALGDDGAGAAPGSSSNKAGTGGSLGGGNGGEAGTGDLQSGGSGGAGPTMDDAGTPPAIPTECQPWKDAPGPAIETSIADSNGLVAAARAREALTFELLPTSDSVRLDDFFNYYRGESAVPSSADGKPSVELALRARDIPTQYDLLVKVTAPPQTTPRSVLTVVVDTTPSMGGIPLTRAGYVLAALGEQLKAGDSLALLTTDPSRGVTLVDSKDFQNDVGALAKTLSVSDDVDFTGAIVKAYEVAAKRFDASAYNRVLVVSDGAEPLEELPVDVISQKADQGIFLVGVGVGPTISYRERLLGLATIKGRGSYVFVENAQEAERLFVNRYDELMGIAQDKIRLEVKLPYYLHRDEEPASSTTDSAEARDQYLPPGASVTFLFRLVTCSPKLLTGADVIEATFSYTDPKTKLGDSVSKITPTLAAAAADPIPALDKALAIRGYVEALRSQNPKRVQKANELVAKANPSADADVKDIQDQLTALSKLVQ